MSYTPPYVDLNLCQICKIPFDIARTRTIDEPVNAAWGSYGQSFVYWDSLQDCENCSGEPDGYTGEELEHIAGPGCQSRRAYSGERITALEMRGINRIQCLQAKGNWRPLPGDEDFEKDAKLCFVTGIGGEGPTEISAAGFEPVKHGVVYTLISNTGFDPAEPFDNLWSLPMHPRCFEMFKTQSLEQRGKVDIDALWRWRDSLGKYGFAWSIEGDTDLEMVLSKSTYQCEPGTEYLVANPMDVLGLHTLLSSCSLPHDAGNSMVFPARASDPKNDLFAKLPVELRLIILEPLSSKDIANLRLISRACSQLPQSYFRRFILSEMPWIWEVRSLPPRVTDWHRLWCKLSRADGGSHIDAKERLRDRYNQDEVPPELSFEIQRIKSRYEAAGSLPPRGNEILKGLRNRRRIHPYIEEILSTTV